MSLIRSKNTKPEIALRKIISADLYPRGYRYRIHYKKIPGSPDVAFVSQKVAVFIDGAFWHGYDFKNMKAKLPKKYWLPKITRNIEHDKEINLRLKKLGWAVVRIWDRDLRENPGKAFGKVSAALKLRGID